MIGKTTTELHFDPYVRSIVNSYVYRLTDPRNGGQTFYVGKGTDNRVFDHIKATAPSDVGPNETRKTLKLDTIQSIQADGHHVGHVIHRHGLDDKTALEVEAALIDAYGDLTNRQGGHGSNLRGPRSAAELIGQYGIEPLVVMDHEKLLFISIKHLPSPWTQDIVGDALRHVEILQQVQFAWAINRRRANRADFVVAVWHGVAVGVFVTDGWQAATSANFPAYKVTDDTWRRSAFYGTPAPEPIWDRFVGTNGKKIENKKMHPGQIGFRYWNCP